MEMQGEQYLSQLLAAGAGRHAHFTSVSHLFSSAHRSPPAVSNDPNGVASGHHYDAQMVGMCGGQVGADHAGSGCYRSMELSPAGFEMDNSMWDSGNGRWPRQETLTLLEIRSRLDAKFKEANHKGPLWDEVARILASEHGYQRSGKKCREKFENLYKYYRKTKEGKAGRQDGKHYRFFRQLDALCGENSGRGVEANTLPINPYPNLHVSNSASTQAVTNRDAQQSHEKIVCEGLNLSDSSGFEDSSSEEADAFTENDHSSMSKKEDLKSQKRGRKSWKSKIKEFIELQMKKFMEMQEAWLEKMLVTLDHREQERLKREEEWRKIEVERLEREHRSWTSERAWIEARDAALMEALHKMSQGDQLNNLTSEEVGTAVDQFHETASHDNHENENGKRNDPSSDCTMNGRKWNESEVSFLIKLKANAELRSEGVGCSDQSGLWEVISAKMHCLGYERSWKSCREKWEETANKDCNKKRKENSTTSISSLHHNLESLYERASSGDCTRESDQINNIGRKMMSTRPSSSAYNSVGTVTQDGCMAFLAVGGSGESLWESYGVKLTDKDENLNC